MARIRSIHPGIFTDEAFMSASAHARLLIIGLWCEAFDDGAVELKALTLKARIFPADNVNMEGLLTELEDLDYFRRFEVKGKPWAAVRNFQRYQRPKKPNSSEVLPENLVNYVGGGEAVGNQHVNGGEKPPQMEDGGGKREERKKDIEEAKASSHPEPDKPARAKHEYPLDLEELWAGYPTTRNMTKAEALPVWKRMSQKDRDWALAGLPGYVAYCKKNPDYTPLHFVRYLTKRRFEAHARIDGDGEVVKPLFDERGTPINPDGSIDFSRVVWMHTA